jgi:glycosyltransferase involved in cell wall biosynthesis
MDLVGDIRRRAAFLQASRIELLHMNNGIHIGCDDWLPAARWRRIPAIVNQMGIIRREASSVRGWLGKRWTRVIAISRHVEEQLRSAGLPRDKIRMVYLGTDLEALTARATRSPDGVRAELGIARDEVMVSMVGHIRRWKGQHIVVQALSGASDDVRGRTRVFFIGGVSQDEQTYRQELENLIATSGLSRHITFLGTREDIPDLMSASDIVVHASTSPEPFGLVVVEAMGLGRPVIAAASGGPSEIIVPGTGLVFDPEDPQALTAHLETLVHDESLRSSLGSRARERARRFSAPRMAMGVQGVYRETLRGMGGGV